MSVRTEPGPDLWLGTVLGGQLSEQDMNGVVVIARQAFRVRALQREYFKTRSNDVLADAKAAERELDTLLTRPSQGGLF